MLVSGHISYICCCWRYGQGELESRHDTKRQAIVTIITTKATVQFICLLMCWINSQMASQLPEWSTRRKQRDDWGWRWRRESWQAEGSGIVRMTTTSITAATTQNLLRGTARDYDKEWAGPGSPFEQGTVYVARCTNRSSATVVVIQYPLMNVNASSWKVPGRF